jgi:hypothetical protein
MRFRKVAILLVLVLFCNILLSEEAYGKSVIMDEEVARAIKLDFVPKEIQSSLTSAITYSQYCTMLADMIAVYNKSYVKTFKSQVNTALTCNDKIRRDNGMMALFYAAVAMRAETLTETDGNWITLHQTIGEPWNDYQISEVNYPNCGKTYKWEGQSFSYQADAYFFCLAKASRVSGNMVFDYDVKSNSMRLTEKLTCIEAIKSVLRLYESTYKIAALNPTKTSKQILSDKMVKRDAILNSETAITKGITYIPGETYSGNAYYISNKGNDKNDGKSQETAWETIDRLSGELNYGDAIFFERGGIWRGELSCTDGVTYSAYGTGEKPKIYGSKENGSGSEKWMLWYEGEDGKKIWKYNNKLTDCGGIVFNDGKSYASRVYAYWNGKKYVFDDNRKAAFNIKLALKSDLTFYSYFDLKGKALPVKTYDLDTTGDLYLRCDKGNPGKLYHSIEFQTTARPASGYIGLIKGDKGIGFTIDNLCVMYALCRGITTSIGRNVVIQNCEVGWIGGDTHEINDWEIAVAGEGIGIEGFNNTARNNYVHDCFDGGIICETDRNWGSNSSDLTIEGNVIERCMSGILIADHADTISKNNMLGNIIVRDNYIMFTGYGWSNDKKYDTWLRDSYVSSINFWDVPNVNSGIDIQNNILYQSTGALIRLGMPDNYLPKFNGNTYIQNKYGIIAFWRLQVIMTSGKVKSIIGDKSGKVNP